MSCRALVAPLFHPARVAHRSAEEGSDATNETPMLREFHVALVYASLQYPRAPFVH